MADDDDRVEITTFFLPEAVRPHHRVAPLVSSRSGCPESHPSRACRDARRLTSPASPAVRVRNPPAATHAGHRADGWDVEKRLKAVRVKVTGRRPRAHPIGDVATGELFAACPRPRDAPASTAVEPVDSRGTSCCAWRTRRQTGTRSWARVQQRDDASDFKPSPCRSTSGALNAKRSSRRARAVRARVGGEAESAVEAAG